MFFGALKFGKKTPGEPELDEVAREEVKSGSFTGFLKTPRTKEFVKTWTSKKKKGEKKPMYTRRGINSLMRNLFQVPTLDSDEKVLLEGEELLSLLGGMDGLQGFLAGWKAKSEGIIKGIKSIFK
jgi:hypothetical protein